MNTLVFHRFRGALVGAALGELLGGRPKPLVQPDLSLFCLDLERADGGTAQDAPLERWGHGVAMATQHLIHREWHGGSEPMMSDAVDTAEAHVLAVIPLALYYHQDRALLLYELDQYRQRHFLTSLSPVVVNAATLFALAIALGCQSHTPSPSGLPSLIQAMSLKEDSPFLATLHDLHRLLQAGQGMEAMETWVKHQVSSLRSSEPRLQQSDLLLWLWVAIALYSVLSTPQFPHLALLRLWQLSFVSPLLSLLTGTLAGVYNGINQFPLDWQLHLQMPHPLHQRIHQTWGISTDDLVQLSDRLFAVWSGAGPAIEPFSNLPLAVSPPVRCNSQSVPS